MDDVESYLSVGKAVVFHAEPDSKEGARFTTFIRGWQKGAYLLLEVPPAHEASLRQEQPCVIRFLTEGSACAFDTRVLDLGSGTYYAYVRVQWPERLAVVRVRRFERVEARIPCTLCCNSQPLEGCEICDISAGGCGVCSKVAVAEKAEITLTFQLPDGATINQVPSVVRSVRPSGDGFVLGCEFGALDEADRNDIEFYVTTTLERLRCACGTGRRALIIDGKATQVRPLQDALSQMGLEVTVAPGMLEGFARLRMKFPNVLLINADSAEGNVLELCRIVKAGRWFKTMPIFVYGGEGKVSESQIKEAGGSFHFLTPSGMPALVKAVAQYVAGLDEKKGEETAAS